MRTSLKASLALAGVTLVTAACGGGGSSLPPSTTGGGAGGGTSHAPATVSMTIKIPAAPSTTSSARNPGYVSSGTQSIGVVVTNQGATPSPAQYVNVSTCPQVSGVTTCMLSVAALPGDDIFAVTAYSAPNGGGSALSTGTIESNVLAGTANTTMPLTLGGVIASLALTTANATLPLGQSTTINVVAKDASGATIVGAYGSAVTLAAPNLALGKTSIASSTDGTGISAAWNLGVSSDTPTSVTATAGTITGSLTMTPGTGFAYYQTGTNSATDNGSTKMIVGPDGKLYYTSIGVVSCTTNNLCVAQIGAVHRFDPTTFTDTEVSLVNSSGIGMKFTSDGALWIAGGAAVNGVNYIYRMAPGAFSASALTAITLPAKNHANTRGFAQDGSGNVWFVDRNGHRYMSIPLAGPYTTASITAHTLPAGPAGTPGYVGSGETIHYVGGVLVVPDQSNGVVDVINPSTATVTAQYVSNLQATFGANAAYDSADPYDAADDGTNVYIANLGDWNFAIPAGDIEAFNPSTKAFTTIPSVAGPIGQQPTVPSVSSSLLYYADFYLQGLAVTNLSSGNSRLYPIVSPGTSYFYGAGAIAAVSDGTAWFPCYGSAPTFQPLCVGHTVYFAKWSLWPSNTISIFGSGGSAAQLMGVMEAPTANSGPFTVTSSDRSVCTVTSPTTANDHNFSIIGLAAGACTVTVTDKNNVSQTVNVSVSTTNGIVQAKKLGDK